MGNYNYQYQNYYNSMANRGKGTSGRVTHTKKNNMNYFTKRIITELTGVLILSLFVLTCKLVVTPKTEAVYNYSKEIVNKNYDYKQIVAKVKGIKFTEIQTQAQEFIDKVISKIKGEDTTKDTIKKEFVMPCTGKITSGFGERKDPISGKKKFHKGIDISVAEKTPIKVSADGIVKVCKEDKELGKYIIIDHGLGIETKYAHLNEINVKEDQKVKKGNIIGKSGNTGKSTGPHLHFEIIYMGESKNPKDFFKIK
ncbi:M23 family metallopeptidase [Haloimpatiens sp. FM7330]|uniref:M23 family metallopeptidase n=1 Tax=Haloimpatiens sp. FM7330 TaxID=3298610 RepID=UPI00362628CA